MKKNLSGADRALHMVIGLALIGAGWALKETAIALLGLLPLISGLLGIDPLYRMLGKSTLRTDKASTYGNYCATGAKNRKWTKAKRK